uniref:Prefoldin subunit 1 n=1 Tax=Varanus komodoensis TaxID=61221 RepID=A0A8D2Q4Q6_VARKO
MCEPSHPQTRRLDSACAAAEGSLGARAQSLGGGKMAAPVDLELKKAFTELQAKVIDTQQKVKLADLQIDQLNRTKKHAHLTDVEIMTLADETRMYEGVGRMFILQSKGVIHNQLLEKQKIAEEKIKELEVNLV